MIWSQTKGNSGAAPEDLVALADPVEELTAQGAVCILGPQQQIDVCARLLDHVSVL